MQASEIVYYIRTKKHEECYKEWSQHPNEDIRYELAKQGYFPDTFINDKSPEVRQETVKAHPEYITKLLRQKKDVRVVAKLLMEEVNPDIEVLKQHIQDLKTFEPHYFRKDVELKLMALTKEPTPLELTMTPYQLYRAQSPLWALKLPPLEIYNILWTEEKDVEQEFKYLE